MLLSEAHGERLEALFAVAVTAGLRVGELCATSSGLTLTWKQDASSTPDTLTSQERTTLQYTEERQGPEYKANQHSYRIVEAPQSTPELPNGCKLVLTGRTKTSYSVGKMADH